MSSDLSRPARLHARFVRACVPSLDARDAREAALVFDELRRQAWRRSIAAWLRFWARETRALAATAWSERLDARRRRRAPAPLPPWAASPAPVPPPSRRAARLAGAGGRLIADLRQALRQLRRTPLFTTVSVLSLALGMAAAIAVFSVANVLLWAPPPYVKDPASLVRLMYGTRSNSGVWSYPDFEDMCAATPALSGAAAFGTDLVVIAAPGGSPRQVVGGQVSGTYFDLLGIPMATGRGLTPSDVGGADVVVIGHGLWRRTFAADPGILGRVIEVNGQPATIVGVAPPGLRSLDTPVEPEVWTIVPRDAREHRGWHSLNVVARLAPGATLPELRTQLDVTARRLFSALSPKARESWGEAQPILAFSERDARVPLGDRVTVMAIFGGVMVLVLLVLGVAASNVANMMLTRASERQAEIAMRLALGARRRQIITQLLVESTLVSGLAGALGLLVVYSVLRALASIQVGFGIPAAVVIDVDLRVASFALGVALVTGVLFGLVPALQVSRPDLVSSLKGARCPARLGLRRVLVTAQVAGSLVLVVASLLFLRSLQEALRSRVGFNPDGVIAVSLDLTQRRYAPEAAARFFERAAERLASVPGVQAVAFARAVPLGGVNIREGGLDIEGHPAPVGDEPSAALNMVSPGYFALLQVPVVSGREFTDADREGAPPVAIVNEAFAAEFWPGQPALGKHLGTREIVGVVRNASYVSIGEAPLAHLWTPLAQNPDLRRTALVRTATGTAIAPDLVGAIRQLDRALLVEARPMREVTRNATLPQRILSAALGLAGLVALGLAMMGVYGVTAYVVSLRAREMGVRVALGADPGRLARMVVGEGLLLASGGVAVGLALAVGLATAARSILIGVGPLDPAALAGGTGLLVAAAVAASYLPARRAARIDPIVSLRAE